MRQIFPFYFKDKSIPKEVRRCFMATLDSTLQEFTSMYDAKSKSKLLINE